VPKSVYAVFSDIHSNLEALEAVLADMATLGIKRCICLGDTVGYGANPAQCLDRVRALGCPILLGNHDEAAAGDGGLDDMSKAAQAGLLYSREKLSVEQRAFLRDLPHAAAAEKVQFVHASLGGPDIWMYVLHPFEAMAHLLTQTEPLCFCGHTHIPAVWHLDEDGSLESGYGEGRVQLPSSGKTLINVGSVGQPRDENPAACYVVCTGDVVEFRRVTYDIAKARRKIARAGLPRFLGERLAHGK
jgi:diadenosine tetraphosphatase ApaH/serine/threonine PP2A family protein phosphatase